MSFFSSPVAYKGQVYASLKKQAIDSGHPFIDNEFPPDDKAINPHGNASNIVWKRPHEICEKPQLFVEGLSSGDVHQGEVGNCWFVAATSCLAIKKAIWTKVIPDYKEQQWDEEDPKNEYGGIFHFSFWRFGEWIDVVIDDMLPTRGGKLIYTHSKSRNEFWSALLEKAYAKVFGCYEFLDGGELAEALEDFTGGVAEPIDLTEGEYMNDETKRDKLFKVMKKAYDNHSLMAAAIPPGTVQPYMYDKENPKVGKAKKKAKHKGRITAKNNDEMEQATEMGLVKGHAYGITAVKRMAIAGSGLFNMFNKDKLNMIRLRNPWGGTEWTGPFSDGSEEWSKIETADKEKMGLTVEDDGEFWMQFEDYCRHFTKMAICRVVNTSFFSMSKTWHEDVHHSEWSKPSRAGGCINNKETFLGNPQFRFDMTSSDEEDQEFMIALTQKTIRTATAENLTMGFTIIRVEENREYRLHANQVVVKSSAFKNSRSIFERLTVPRGRYVIVASTFDPGVTGNLLLRLYTSDNAHSHELVKDKPATSFCNCMPCFSICKYPTLVTSIKVLRAVGLEKQDTIGGADPYCIIRCENNEVRSHTLKDSLNPEFDTAAVFYRKSPNTVPIKINIWNNNTLRDSFMGRCEFASSADMTKKVLDLDLFGRKKDERTKKRAGKVFIEISQTRSLTSI